ncbi:MAG: hypothetical protein MJ231_06300 [bacterium]|nr:hypothetical protein [bacterium]
MKKILFFICLVLFFIGNSCFAKTEFSIVAEDSQIIYEPSTNSWVKESDAEDAIILTKNDYDGSKNYSEYRDAGDKLIFALDSGCEFLYGNRLIVVNNNYLKYAEVVYNGEKFEEVYLSSDEVKTVFPDVELIYMSELDDNFMYRHKPCFKKQKVLLFNDTEKCFYKLTCKPKRAQDDEVRGYIKLNHPWLYRFKHYGERNGKFKMLVF